MTRHLDLARHGAAGLPPTVVMFNDLSHLPTELRWTGFPDAARP